MPVRPCAFARAACERALCICACLPVCVCVRARTRVRGAPCFPAGPMGSLLIHARQVRMCLHGAESECVSSPEEGRSRDNPCPGRYVGRGEIQISPMGQTQQKAKFLRFGDSLPGTLVCRTWAGCWDPQSDQALPLPFQSQRGALVCSWTQAWLPNRAMQGSAKQEKACLISQESQGRLPAGGVRTKT